MVGFLLVDKPAGCTSHDVVARVRRVLGGRRVGHAGTLDPIATGLLVLGIGQATRLLGRLQLDTKTYEATMRLGLVTDTQDVTGVVLDTTTDVSVDAAAVRRAAERFRGAIAQVPPAYSAVKRGGLPAYRRARRGEVYEPPPPREVTLHELEVTRVAGADVHFRVTCSSGTYVRTLCHDWGAALGVGACMAALRRTRSGAFTVTDAIPLDRLATPDAIGQALRPVRDGFPHLPLRACDEAEVEAVRHGKLLPAGLLAPGAEVCLTLPDGAAFALARVRLHDGGRVLKAAPVLTEVIEAACGRTTG